MTPLCRSEIEALLFSAAQELKLTRSRTWWLPPAGMFPVKHRKVSMSAVPYLFGLCLRPLLWAWGTEIAGCFVCGQDSVLIARGDSIHTCGTSARRWNSEGDLCDWHHLDSCSVCVYVYVPLGIFHCLKKQNLDHFLALYWPYRGKWKKRIHTGHSKAPFLFKSIRCPLIF